MRADLASCAIGLVTCVSTAAADPPFDPLVNMNYSFTPAAYAGCDVFDDDAVGLCDNLESTVDGSELSYAWVVVSRDGGIDGLIGSDGGAGIGGIQWGVAYEPTVAVLSWSLCTGGNQIPQDDFGGTWPESNTGNAATWAAACYLPSGEVAKVGYFTLAPGSDGLIDIRDDPRLPEWAPCVGHGEVQACRTGPITCICLENLGFAIAGSGSVPFCGNACDATPVEETSWGRLKNLF